MTTSLPVCANCGRPATIRWRVRRGYVHNCDRCQVLGGYDPELVGQDDVAGSDVLTVAEAAAELRVHPETIKRRIRKGELRTLPRNGSLIRIARDELHTPAVPKRRPMPEPAEVIGRRSTSVAWPK